MDFKIEDVKEQKKRKQKNIKNLYLYVGIGFFFIASILMLIYIFKTLSGNTNNPKKTPVEVKKVQIVNEDSNERPIAIMIDNNVGNDNHAGLQSSYINYEIIVEGGLTRIMALYKDKDVELIGPIRSSRHYFLDYALEHDAIYAHFGWSPYAERDITSLKVDNINGLTEDEPFWRDNTIAAPHNVFTSINKLLNTSTKKNYRTTTNNWKVLKYNADKIDLAKQDETSLISANTVSIQYSNNENRSYTYDSENEYYLRFMNNNAHIDKVTNQQLNYKNIVIMKVENKNLDNEGRQDLNTTGSGNGYFITNGNALPITWNKSSRTSKTRYTYLDGSEVKFNDGNTFIQVVPVESVIIIE